MPTIRTRAAKTSALTHNEVDANFTRPSTQKTTTYPIVVGDNRSTIEGNHASTPFTITLPTVAAAGAAEPGDFRVTVTNINAAVVSVDGSTTETINGSTDLITLKQWDSATFELDSAGAGWVTTSRVGDVGAIDASAITASAITAGGDILVDTDSAYDLAATGERLKDGYIDTITVTDTITLGSDTVNPTKLSTEQASTSGTEIDFTDVPAWAKRVEILLEGVSTDGTAIITMELGDASSFETSGYLGTACRLADGSAVQINPFTDYFTIVKRNSTGDPAHGILTLALKDSANNTWVLSGQSAHATGQEVYLVAGSKSLTGALTRIRIQSADTFDAGSINVLYS